MKSMNTLRVLVLLLLSLAIAAVGCGSSSSGTAATNADVNGLWTSYHTEAGGAEQGPELWRIEQLGTTDDAAVTDSVNATSNAKINGSSITITKDSPEGVYTLTGTVNGNTMSGTYSGTNGSSGTWRTVKVKLITAATTTATIPVGGTTTFTAAAGNYDDTSVSLDSGSASGLTWATSDASVASINSNGVATGIKVGGASITASYGGITSAGVTLAVTAASGGGTSSGTLTISLDLSSAATVTTSSALVSAAVYTAGTLVAESPANISITGKAGSFPVKQTANPSTNAVLVSGQYTVYILIDNNGNGTMDTGEYGKIATVTMAGNKTLSLTAADFVATEGWAVMATGGTVPDGKGMRCDWLVPGGAWQADPNTSTVARAFSFTLVNTFSGGSVTTDANTPLIPGQYDLHCWVDMDGNNVKNTGDFFGTNTNYLLGDALTLTVVP